jgi:hypothetical protein
MRRCLLSAAVVLAAWLACAVPAPAAMQKAIWGPATLSAGNLECGGGPSCSAFPVYSELGVDVYQYRMLWSTVAPSRPANPTNPNDPAYRWPADLDAAVQQAQARGIQVGLLVERAPSWSNGGRADIWSPTDPTDFADFLTAASRRYPYVGRWMIWGEPNRSDHFMPTGRKLGARTYSVLLDDAYAALKSLDPGDVVVGGMTDNRGTVPPARWIRSLRLPGGGRPRMNEWGFNPFDARYPRLRDRPIGQFRGLNDVDTVWRDVKRSFGRGSDRPRGLWLSEWTLQSGHDSFAFAFHVSRKGQARRLKAGYKWARRAGHVTGLGWYRLDDQPEADGSANWGLETAQGERKPSFFAFQGAP